MIDEELADEEFDDEPVIRNLIEARQWVPLIDLRDLSDKAKMAPLVGTEFEALLRTDDKPRGNFDYYGYLIFGYVDGIEVGYIPDGADTLSYRSLLHMVLPRTVPATVVEAQGQCFLTVMLPTVEDLAPDIQKLMDSISEKDIGAVLEGRFGAAAG